MYNHVSITCSIKLCSSLQHNVYLQMGYGEYVSRSVLKCWHGPDRYQEHLLSKVRYTIMFHHLQHKNCVHLDNTVYGLWGVCGKYAPTPYSSMSMTPYRYQNDTFV